LAITPEDKMTAATASLYFEDFEIIDDMLYNFLDCQGITKDWTDDSESFQKYDREKTIWKILREKKIALTCKEDRVVEERLDGKFLGYEKYEVCLSAYQNNSDFGKLLEMVIVDLVKNQSPIAEIFFQLVTKDKIPGGF
jgi:hypothetical protein